MSDNTLRSSPDRLSEAETRETTDDTEVVVSESTPLFFRAVRGMSRNDDVGEFDSNQVDFPSYTKQRQAICGLICAEFLASIANHIYGTWIPFMMVMYEFAFVTPSTDPDKEPEFNSAR